MKWNEMLVHLKTYFEFGTIKYYKNEVDLSNESGVVNVWNSQSLVGHSV